MATWGAVVRSAQIVFAPSATDLGYKVAVHDKSSPSPRDPSASRPARFRWAWWLLAYISLGLGILGIFVPMMPTTVFILIAAFAASRGSERLHRYLVTHPRFGPMIRDWHQHRAVSRRAKWAATWTMLGSAAILLGVMLWTGSHRWWMVALPIVCMTTVAVWLWMRPEPPRTE
ncbi:MAG: DUF454 domain-containing protein [Xanthomonas sp.]|nr:DUF454 domain-containing protein [Xanthomonas sp.]MBL8256471.1 YbaN family protein [Pseudoxanthomonas mexicana]